MTPRHPLATLRDGVERQQRELRVALATLATATRDAANPRHWIRENPFLCVLGAFALGHWLGGRTRGAN